MSVGRPTKWTEETRNTILLYLENGATFKRAGILAGVSQSTFQAWKAQGIKDQAIYEEYLKKDREYIEKILKGEKIKPPKEVKKSEYLVFLEQIYLAKQKYIAWLQEQANNQARVDGKLALEMLARKEPLEWGRKDTLDLKGDFNINNFDIQMTEAQEAAYLERLKDMYGDEEE
jgi:hypothetical protein